MPSLPAESGGGRERSQRSGGRGKRRRLSRSGEFERVYREGRSQASRYLVVYVFPRADAGPPRLGVSVSRKVGGAVESNRIKRPLYQAIWALSGEPAGGHEFVVVARPPASELAAARGQGGVEQALRSLLDQADLTGDRAA